MTNKTEQKPQSCQTDVSFQYGAEWSRNTLIEEIQRRQELIISEPNGIVRETMIDNLLLGLQ